MQFLKYMLFTVWMGCSLHILAQEQLSSLPFNPTLFGEQGRAYKAALDAFKKQHELDLIAPRFYYEDNLIYLSDTLELPFTDDFYPAKTRSYDFMDHLDSTVPVAGSCLQFLNIASSNLEVSVNPTFTYSFDTATQTQIANPNAPIVLMRKNDTTSDCLSYGEIQTWYPAFDSVTKWDSLSGEALIKIHYFDSVLPFRELFFVSAQPNELWTDNYAWVNNTNPVDAICLGVATLDGLNQYGLPYADPPLAGSYGEADYLTSRPINLAGLDGADSLYLSFYFQAGGRGDWPDKEDSLMLQFRDNIGQWHTVWSHDGFNSPDSLPSNFQQQMVKLPEQIFVTDPFYFYKGFQFRFYNWASTAGNNDHWHIDYVRLDKNRDANDTILSDICLIDPLPTMLEFYSMMPWAQFEAGGNWRDSVQIAIRNNGINTPSTDWNVTADMTLPFAATVYHSVVFSFPADPLVVRDFSPASDFVNPAAVSPDTLVLIETRFNIDPTADNLSLANDTVLQKQQFDYRLGYDDGTAEKAYGLVGSDGDLKKFAYRFVLPQADTVKGLEIHFTHIDEDVENLLFNFVLWKDIDREAAFEPKDSVITKALNRRPHYIDSINGMVTLLFDTFFYVKDTFYLGFEQTDDRNLQIGYDKNSELGFPHIFVQVNDHWAATSLSEKGSPMLRAVLQNYHGRSTSIPENNTVASSPIEIWPNPVRNALFIATAKAGDFCSVYNVYGELQFQQHWQDQALDVSKLTPGIYILQLQNESGLHALKFIRL